MCIPRHEVLTVWGCLPRACGTIVLGRRALGLGRTYAIEGTGLGEGADSLGSACEWSPGWHHVGARIPAQGTLERASFSGIVICAGGPGGTHFPGIQICAGGPGGSHFPGIQICAGAPWARGLGANCRRHSQIPRPGGPHFPGIQTCAGGPGGPHFPGIQICAGGPGGADFPGIQICTRVGPTRVGGIHPL